MTGSVGHACCSTACHPKPSSPLPGADRAAQSLGLGFEIGIEDARITLTEINNRAKTLARSQSADIGSQLLQQKVNVVSGRGELIDNVAGMAHHQVRVRTPAGSPEFSRPTWC